MDRLISVSTGVVSFKRSEEVTYTTLTSTSNDNVDILTVLLLHRILLRTLNLLFLLQRWQLIFLLLLLFGLIQAILYLLYVLLEILLL